jgi:hypothetical protein
LQRVKDFSGIWRKARMGERGTRREGEMKRRKSLCTRVYDVVSNEREREQERCEAMAREMLRENACTAR